MTDIEELYRDVSRAISTVESIPEGRARDAAEAWLRVAHLERRIAERAPASSVSGEAARVGAVRAAALGRDLRMAQELASLYVRQPSLAERPRLELERLLGEIEAELATLTSRDPRVLPVDAKIAA